MNYKIINEIEKKRKKFFKNIFICFAILSLVSYFLAMFGFSEYFERYFWSSIIYANIPLLPLWISIPIVLRWQAREEISAMALAVVCEQFTGFKFVPPFNSKNKYYDTIKKNKIDWPKLPLPPTKILFSFTIKESDIHNILVKNMFTGFNKAGQDIKLCNILFYRNVGNKPCCNFNGLILTVKTNKNLNSTTYLQTDIRFLGINMSDEPNLPKIELPNLSTKKINTYSNNPNVAEKLASPVLCDTLTNLKNLFQVPQAQVIFYNEYVIFVLGSGFEMHKFFPLDMSLFRRFDISKVGKAIINFKTLYDLTNKVKEFTKGI